MRQPVTRSTLVGAAGLAIAASASAQDLTFRAVQLFDNTDDIEDVGTAADPFRIVPNLGTDPEIGTNPISVAYDGVNLYLGGNVNGAPGQVAVAQYADFVGGDGRPAVALPGSVFPATGAPFPGSGQGWTGMDWSDDFGLLATVDFGGDTSIPQIFQFELADPADTVLSLAQTADGIRGIAGPSWDFGFEGAGLPETPGGPIVFPAAASIATIGTGVPFGLNPDDFSPAADIYGADVGAPFNIFEAETGSTIFRDLDISPVTGLVAARAANNIVIGDRTEFQGTDNDTLRSITPASGFGGPPGIGEPNPAFVVNQNVEILHGLLCRDSEFVIANDRPTPGFAGDFEDLVQIFDAATSAPLSYELVLPDGVTPFTPPAGTNIFSFHWFEPEQWLFVVEGNSLVYVLELISPCDLNVDGELDIFDTLEYLALFDADSPEADFDEDGDVDADDALGFVTEITEATS